MAQDWRGRWIYKLGLVSFLSIVRAVISGDCAFAQITSDSTLGPDRSIVKSNINTKGSPADRIVGGATRGANLFHSFQEFNVGDGQRVYFANPTGIKNILSRVTGSSSSDIQGTLGVLGKANLFLINPNGIIFGSNASLDVNGSFIASTAGSLKFSDNTHFNATAPQTAPLLTISVPTGLQFEGNPGSIKVQGNGQGRRLPSEHKPIDTTDGLRVKPNQTLGLVGGDVALEGGTLKTAGGRIELGSVAGPGLVSLTPTVKSWTLSYDSVPTFGDIQLYSAAAVDASGRGGGDVYVQGRQVRLTGGSQIDASTLKSKPGGTVSVTASESVELLGTSKDYKQDKGQFSAIIASVHGEATGPGGNVTIQTKQLIIRDGGKIRTATLGKGNAGTLKVNASELVEVSGTSEVGKHPSRLSARTIDKGDAGNLEIETEQLIVQDKGLVDVSTTARGNAGSLTIKAGELIVQNEAEVIVGTTARGNAGDLVIDAKQLNVEKGARVSTSTSSSGRGGKLTVTADTIELVGRSADGKGPSGLFARTLGTGDAGALTVTTRELNIQKGARVSTSTLSNKKKAGKGGDLTVTADTITLDGTGTLKNGGEIRPSGLAAQTVGTGDAGDLAIKTKLLSIQNGAEVTVGSDGSGNAGNLSVMANSIVLDRGKIEAVTGAGDSGNIILGASAAPLDLLLMRNNSQISTTAGEADEGAGGDGGNITIDTNNIVALENSDIRANAYKGQGGNVLINTQGDFRSPDSDITASSELGIDGVVELNTPDIDPSQGLVALPEEVVDVSGLIAQTCPAGSGPRQSKFVITGRGGVPSNPGETLNTDAVQVDLVTLNPEVNKSSTAAVSTSPSHPSSTPIVEAQGWVRDANSNMVLTAQAPMVTPHSPRPTPASC